MNITYGTHSFDFSKLPSKSVEAMLKRGVTHYLGSEQASKVSSWADKFEKENSRAPNEDERAEAKSGFVAAAIAALNAGEVGMGSRGPAVDPIEAEVERLAKQEINAVLKANGAKFSGKGEDRKVAFADGQSFTMDQLIERRLAAHGERLRKEAEKSLKAKAKELEKAKVQAESVTTDALGL